MDSYAVLYEKKIIEEIEAMPEEYLPALLGMVRLFRQSVDLKPAAQSFRQGWEEAMKDETLPIENLWKQVPAGRAAWLAGAQALAERIRQRRGDQEIDVDALIEVGALDWGDRLKPPAQSIQQ